MLRQELLERVVQVLNSTQIEYMITGSVVSSIQGEPRLTHDIDIVVAIQKEDICKLIESFPVPRYYLDEFAARDAVDRHSMFNLIDTIEGDKIDFWLLSGEEFDASRFSRKQQVNFLGLTMVVSSPEDTILAKLRWSKMSGGSEKQFVDALRIYELQYEILDTQYLLCWAKALVLEDLWDRLIMEAEVL